MPRKPEPVSAYVSEPEKLFFAAVGLEWEESQPIKAARKRIKRLVKGLIRMDRSILLLRFGLANNYVYTYQRIAQRFRMKRGGVYYREQAILKNLREAVVAQKSVRDGTKVRRSETRAKSPGRKRRRKN